MNEAFLTAIQLAFNYSLDMVAWSAGLMAFSATLLPRARHPTMWTRTLLIVMFVVYAVSVVSGVFCLSVTIGFLTDPSEDALMLWEARTFPAEMVSAAVIQFVAFFCALLLNVILGVWRSFDRAVGQSEI
jgi:hypothetical protein